VENRSIPSTDDLDGDLGVLADAASAAQLSPRPPPTDEMVYFLATSSSSSTDLSHSSIDVMQQFVSNVQPTIDFNQLLIPSSVQLMDASSPNDTFLNLLHTSMPGDNYLDLSTSMVSVPIVQDTLTTSFNSTASVQLIGQQQNSNQLADHSQVSESKVFVYRFIYVP